MSFFELGSVDVSLERPPAGHDRRACGPSTRASGATGWSGRLRGRVAFVEALGRETFIGVDVGASRLVVFEEGRATRDVGDEIEFGLVPDGPALLLARERRRALRLTGLAVTSFIWA